jgi:cytochrome c-type biogenesis protein CcmH
MNGSAMRHPLRSCFLAAFAALTLFTAAPAYAVQPDEILKDTKLEARARALSSELRCMVCQNQSIDDSNAPLARDLRLLVRERLTAGDSNSQVLDYLVARYGEFVLLKPRLNWHNAMLWSAPLAVLLIGIAWIVVIVRRRAESNAAHSPEAASPLTETEKARVAEMLKSTD